MSMPEIVMAGVPPAAKGGIFAARTGSAVRLDYMQTPSRLFRRAGRPALGQEATPAATQSEHRGSPGTIFGIVPAWSLGRNWVNKKRQPMLSQVEKCVC